jgi:molybdopterin-guanine dinucleotide biosynthesis protein A
VSPAATRVRFDAVVLAGGGARRMGGIDKPALRVGSATLLDRVLLAVSDAHRVVVVGPRRRTCRPVTWVSEHPAGGGPLAALGAALPDVRSDVVAVLAADLPFLDAPTVGRLLAARGEHDGAMLVDETGRDQLLVGVWRTGALRAAFPTQVCGGSLRQVLSRLDVVRESTPAMAGRPAPWTDCDTPDELRLARRSA